MGLSLLPLFCLFLLSLENYFFLMLLLPSIRVGGNCQLRLCSALLYQGLAKSQQSFVLDTSRFLSSLSFLSNESSIVVRHLGVLIQSMKMCLITPDQVLTLLVDTEKGKLAFPFKYLR